MLSAPAWLLMKTPREGAQTTIYCAVTEGLEEKSGYYFRYHFEFSILLYRVD